MKRQMKAAYERFNRIEKAKKAIEENKLDNKIVNRKLIYFL